MVTVSEFSEKIPRCWSTRTSGKYTEHNPARGQCSVTALVAQDCLGGDIVKTDVNGDWHFYNLIGGDRYDFTAKQFDGPIDYQDKKSSREDAFSDTTVAQYEALSRNFSNVC